VIFECETDGCGGFDFRFATDVLPAPAMHVDLGDFRFAAFARGMDEVASLLVSRGGAAVFVQLTRVSPAEAAAGPVETFPAAPPVLADATSDPQPEVAAALAATGAVVLEDLAFASGSADLGGDAFASLDRLADYLRANPGHRVTVVGHTDAVGGLEGNIALSQRRAASVVERLVGQHGVPRAQLSAAGAGYLAPRASNLTEEGRALNRRVEVVLTAVD
jgi:outer membrane protein OmpA-like peptidoglycan-associated protein